MKKQTKASLMLLLASVIWGATFAVQREGMRFTGPFTFTAVRTLVCAAFLVPCFLLFDCAGGAARPPKNPKTLWTGGTLCGVALFLACNLQQIGLVYSTAGKGGFITSLYIVLVPLMGFALGKRPRPLIWLSVLLAVAGMYLLSVTESLTIGRGDLATLACAFFFAFQILLVDRFAPRVDCIRMTCIEFLVCGLLSLIPMLLLEEPKLNGILSAWFHILFSGILSGGVAYSLQTLAQKELEPARASLLMCLESVFAALTGWLFLRETLSLREFSGCALVFAAVLLSVLTAREKHKASACGTIRDGVA